MHCNIHPGWIYFLKMKIINHVVKTVGCAYIAKPDFAKPDAAKPF